MEPKVEAVICENQVAVFFMLLLYLGMRQIRPSPPS